VDPTPGAGPGARVWFEAARPRTLPAAVAPVLVGTAAAASPLGDRSTLRAVLALVVALALQVAVNYANDLFDGLAGIDTTARRGPRRAVASGLVTPAAMRRALVVALAVAGVAGLTLAVLVDLRLLAVGAAAVAAALGYSGGRRPYASRGLGEVSVFVFFGLVATVGSAYVQDGRVTLLPVVASVPVGLLAVVLLVVNNLRDVPTDGPAGKRTLAVRLGIARTKALHAILLAASAVGVVGCALVAGSPWPLIGLTAALPALSGLWAVRSADVVDASSGPVLIGALEATGRAQLVLAVTLAAGIVTAVGP
jgi:1,4-dihydroxy-2-naphthoate polyprenyltransferase